MNKDNNFGRLLLLLLLAFGICLGLYYLPDQLFGMKIKKVDLLSDLRIKPESLSMDSLRMQLEQPDTVRIDSAAVRDSILKTTGIDSVALALRDSLYKVMYADKGADSLGTRIEDYSVGHIGLKRFFAALRNSRQANRPVRVAFLGDSFIEGDIVVADFRSGMQERFGGRGVGFVPVTSVAAQFRPTIEQKAEGWTTWSMLTDHHHRYTLSGMTFEPKGEKPSISIKTTDRYPELKTVSSLKFLYEKNIRTQMTLVCNGTQDTICETLEPTTAITQYEQTGTFTEASFSFADTAGFRALGVALEDNSGVIVDNYSLRGNSGMILSRLDSTRCRELNEIRPYDLVVLQYGVEYRQRQRSPVWLVRQADGRSRTPRTRLFSGCRYPDAGGFGQEPTSGRNLRNDACRISLAARTAAGGSPFGGRFLECLWGDGRREQHDPFRGEQLG